MAFKELSSSEKEMELQCMKAIAEGSEIEDWEFHTRLGIVRSTLRKIINSWPEIDDSSNHSDECLAINNCMNEICNGIHIPSTEWRKHFTQSRDEIRHTYHKWLRLGGHSSAGMR
jgi:hypothetical protein